MAKYKSLVDRIAGEIRSGALRPGHRLPPQRTLARRHGLALATASRVYAELERMGLVIGETGRGTYVRHPSESGPESDLGFARIAGVNLNTNMPSTPGQDAMLRAALRQLASHGDLDALLRHQPHLGRFHERESVARYLATHDIEVDPERVSIVQGAQHGLSVTLMALLRPGEIVAVDALIYPGLKVAATLLGLELLPIRSGPEGPDLAQLQDACARRRIRAVHCMPTLQNPLSWVMDADARDELVRIARRHDLLLIEDAAFNYLVPSPPPALVTLAPERTFHISGLSKGVVTSLRFGYVIAPETATAAMERVIRATTHSTPAIVSALACQWLDDGTVRCLEAERRADTARRQERVARLLPDQAMRRHPCSYFVWLDLSNADMRAEELAHTLAAEGIAVATAAPFATTAHIPNALRLALGSTTPEELETALRRIATHLFIH